MIRTVVTGAAGRMGRQIVKLVSETEGLTLTGACEHADNPTVGQDAGELAGVGALGVKVAAGLENAIEDADVIIDFTSAEASMAHLKIACDKNTTATMQ